jgi:hypothetical protein
MTAAALMLPPFNDFFKVGVSSAGNHDNNVYNQNWSEQHHGLREVPISAATGTGTTGTGTGAGRGGRAGGGGGGPEEELWFQDEPQATTGTKFDHAGTVRLMNALIKANKRFDFLLMPGKQHGFADMQPYFTQRMMEYFVQYLMGEFPPAGADMKIGG